MRARHSRLNQLFSITTDREEVWDNFGQADKPMVYGHISDSFKVKLERKVMHFTSVLWHKSLILAHITFKFVTKKRLIYALCKN